MQRMHRRRVRRSASDRPCAPTASRSRPDRAAVLAASAAVTCPFCSWRHTGSKRGTDLIDLGGDPSHRFVHLLVDHDGHRAQRLTPRRQAPKFRSYDATRGAESANRLLGVRAPASVRGSPEQPRHAALNGHLGPNPTHRRPPFASLAGIKAACHRVHATKIIWPPPSVGDFGLRFCRLVATAPPAVHVLIAFHRQTPHGRVIYLERNETSHT